MEHFNVVTGIAAKKQCSFDNVYFFFWTGSAFCQMFILFMLLFVIEFLNRLWNTYTRRSFFTSFNFLSFNLHTSHFNFQLSTFYTHFSSDLLQRSGGYCFRSSNPLLSSPITIFCFVKGYFCFIKGIKWFIVLYFYDVSIYGVRDLLLFMYDDFENIVVIYDCWIYSLY